ncbi:MAG TPA: hypothetical protein ENN51_00340 [candidate division WOR-3 bacterium]|uniref:Zf-HC2 domain-containing protein n=1 Tax=candidate division WOR-3 bacterium TaxID=2052148 RepID=A0A7V0XE49_UNCW3|nr:hypothetical protein [candidate division WOR-3 bacterium]
MTTDDATRPEEHEELAIECSACAELMDLIAEYLDDSETVEMRRALMEHATTCDHCARLLWSMRRVVATCRTEAGSDVPGETHIRLWQVLVEEFRAECKPDEREASDVLDQPADREA